MASQRMVRDEGSARNGTTNSQPDRDCVAMDRTCRWGTAARNTPSVRQPEPQVLARPRDRRVEQAGDADPVWQSAFDGGFDEARREEGQRDRHIDVALAAGLPRGDAVDCCGAGLDLGQPLPSARDGGDELDPGVGADRKNLCSRRAFGSDDVAMPPMRGLAPRHGEDEGIGLFVLWGLIFA
jgi:hypothetical protein